MTDPIDDLGEMEPIGDEPEISDRQEARMELDEEQTVISERTDKFELTKTDDAGRADKDLYHEDIAEDLE
ncbi:hypothetical protein GCM10009000_104370 [Halobacterium noricense]